VFETADADAFRMRMDSVIPADQARTGTPAGSYPVMITELRRAERSVGATDFRSISADIGCQPHAPHGMKGSMHVSHLQRWSFFTERCIHKSSVSSGGCRRDR
jgi:hypothetical protein